MFKQRSKSRCGFNVGSTTAGGLVIRTVAVELQRVKTSASTSAPPRGAAWPAPAVQTCRLKVLFGDSMGKQGGTSCIVSATFETNSKASLSFPSSSVALVHATAVVGRSPLMWHHRRRFLRLSCFRVCRRRRSCRAWFDRYWW